MNDSNAVFLLLNHTTISEVKELLQFCVNKCMQKYLFSNLNKNLKCFPNQSFSYVYE